jgi:chromosome segregation ATPase
VLVALAWRSERSDRRQSQHALSATRAELSTTRVRLAATRNRLDKAETLTRRQAAILSQAAVVLRQVDPLLTDVDRLQQITSDIQSRRDTFVSDSAQMTSDLLTLENYIARTDPAYIDFSYETALVSQVNSELDTVRADASSLSSSDSDYSAASDSFGNHADRFTTAIRLLQKQLQTLPKPAR